MSEEVKQQIDTLTARLAQLETELDTEKAKNAELISTEPHRIKMLENMVHKITRPETYFQYDYAHTSTAALPEKFVTTDIPKFKAKDNPVHHLRSFQGCMALKKVDISLYPAVFPMSLESTPLNWFYSLDPQKVSTWDDITKAFLAQYSCNTEFQVTLPELEVLKQKENEGFTTFYTRRSSVPLTLS